MYLNNILVASPDRLTQAHHLRCVLQHFQDNCLVHNKAKCEFFRSEVEFLGLKVTAGGVAPIPEQLAAVRDFPQPGTVKELQAFLGAVKFCRHFIPARRRSSYPSPLSSRATKRGPTSWNGGPPCFNNIKVALMLSVCLAFPSDTTEISLATNASATHVGAIFQQKEGPN